MSKTSDQVIVFLVLAATLAVALFGFSLMTEPGHMIVGCFGTVPGGDCVALGPIGHFQLHMNAFQSVSTGIFEVFAAFAGLLIFLGVVFLLYSFKNRSDNGLLRRSVLSRADIDAHLPAVPLLEWLMLHEKRDPSFPYAMNR